MEFVFFAISDAVDVELDAGAIPAGGKAIRTTGQDAVVTAGAGSDGSFDLSVAVAADSAVGRQAPAARIDEVPGAVEGGSPGVGAMRLKQPDDAGCVTEAPESFAVDGGVEVLGEGQDARGRVAVQVAGRRRGAGC